MPTLLLAAIGALGLAEPVRAGLLPVNVTILPEAGNYRWTYSVVIPTDQYITSGDFFTIYDFEGFTGVASVAMPNGWSVSVQNWGKNPGLVSPVDDPAKSNLSFTYDGDPIYGGVGLGNFSAVTTMNMTADGIFTSRTHRNSDNKTEDSITFTDVPRPSSDTGGGTPPPVGDVPEPATLALAGIGLPALGLARLIRRRKAA
jgi:hypothetical protein